MLETVKMSTILILYNTLYKNKSPSNPNLQPLYAAWHIKFLIRNNYTIDRQT